MGFTRSSFNMKSFAFLALFCLASPALGHPQYYYGVPRPVASSRPAPAAFNARPYAGAPAGPASLYAEGPAGPAAPIQVPNMLPEPFRSEIAAVMKTGLAIVENPIMDTEQFQTLYQQSRDIAAKAVPQELKEPLYALGQTSLKVLTNPTDANTLTNLMEQSIDVVNKVPQSIMGQARFFMDMFLQPSAGAAPAIPSLTEV